jgi:hypothetical protein
MIYDFYNAMSDKVFLSTVGGLYYSIADNMVYDTEPNPVNSIKDIVRIKIIYSREEYG